VIVHVRRQALLNIDDQKQAAVALDAPCRVGLGH